MIQALIFALTANLMPLSAQLPAAYDHLEKIEAVAEQGICTQWTATALNVGWQLEELAKLFRIMHRESRCNPLACSQSDSGRVCRDWGLMQINEYSWKGTIRRLGLEMEQMWDPFWNLRFARILFEWDVERGGDGWQPWKLPGRNA